MRPGTSGCFEQRDAAMHVSHRGVACSLRTLPIVRAPPRCVPVISVPQFATIWCVRPKDHVRDRARWLQMRSRNRRHAGPGRSLHGSRPDVPPGPLYSPNRPCPIRRHILADRTKPLLPPFAAAAGGGSNRLVERGLHRLERLQDRCRAESDTRAKNRESDMDVDMSRPRGVQLRHTVLTS